jgi:hypothetical protein
LAGDVDVHVAVAERDGGGVLRLSEPESAEERVEGPEEACRLLGHVGFDHPVAARGAEGAADEVDDAFVAQNARLRPVRRLHAREARLAARAAIGEVGAGGDGLLELDLPATTLVGRETIGVRDARRLGLCLPGGDAEAVEHH